VRVHPPRADGDPWVIERDGRHYYRIGPDLARLAELLTGDYDQDELLGLLGDRWTADGLHSGVTKLRDMNLIDDGRARTTSATRRVSLVPPMSVQFSVVDPSRVLRPMAPLIGLLSRRPAQLLCWALALGGLSALALAAHDVQRLISVQMSSAVLVLVAAGVFAGIAIHELSHGAALMHFGARPRRMGVMLFYLFPAFFCDVSDGWLLSRRMQRVRVALAGIFAQMVCAGTAGVAGALLPDSLARDGLLLLSLTTYLAAVVNLVPFVKLDGYLALMSLLDISNLRTRAMRETRSFLAQTFYGARRDRALPQRWVVPYGLACMAFPLYLVGGVAFALWAQTFQGTGIIGAVMTFGFMCGLLYVVVRGFVRIQRSALRGGAPVARLVLVNLALGAVLVVALSVVHVAEKVPGYYRIDDGGGARLVVVTSADTDRIASGQPVELRSNGVVLRTRVGAAEVGAEGARPAALPMADVLPIAVDPGVDMEALEFPLELLESPEQDSGVARVVVGDRSLWGWLYSRYVGPLTRL
jgi:putative peptide zinc metalloprotease protein